MPEGVNKVEEKLPFDAEKLGLKLSVAATIDEVCKDLSGYSEIISSKGPQTTEDVINMVRSLHESAQKGDLPIRDLIEAFKYIDDRGQLHDKNVFLNLTSNGSIRRTVIELIFEELSVFDENLVSKLLSQTTNLEEFYDILDFFEGIPAEAGTTSGIAYYEHLLIIQLGIQKKLDEDFLSLWKGKMDMLVAREALNQFIKDTKDMTKDVVDAGGIKENFERLMEDFIRVNANK